MRVMRRRFFWNTHSESSMPTPVRWELFMTKCAMMNMRSAQCNVTS